MIRRVLPVLWMTSCFHIMGSSFCGPLCGESVTAKLFHRFQPNFALNDISRLICTSSWLRTGGDAIYDCLVVIKVVSFFSASLAIRIAEQSAYTTAGAAGRKK